MELVVMKRRVAAEASRARHLLRTLIQTAVMWLVFFGLAPWGIAHLEAWLGVPSFVDRWSQITGIIAFTLCSVLGLWSSVSLAWYGEGTQLPTATARRLVVAGPYRFVRNPMAISGLGQGAAIGLWFGSWSILAGVVAGVVVWQVFVRPSEEADLEARFGDEYRRYRAAVGCWLPTGQRWIDDQ
ncbi:MAG: isoprenylcysteine carboxylmethyltransferase family protein [Planctomycetes bacterium]|nr:isoprenylcysteine carboxylmethyltransferase family protein [Planctomycetota bacterium]